jgi:hypothetical protein
MAVNLIALKVHEHHLIVTHEVTNTGSDRSRRETVEHSAETFSHDQDPKRMLDS